MRREEVEALTAKSQARTELPKPTGLPPALGAESAEAAEKAAEAWRGDDLVALLRALSGCYEAHPQLWLDPELR